ncbi:hypothetical protein CDD80_6602 [Ophiocordyceps camponoti-rufipedis]|uniref:Xylanolytic transcriptional activator regulatory domain-containing protein n=1 Tax=Ophiocordyceps camponoti-rufipedis TaxID=2004952 RepID=A0A2C5YPV8_9HYPO|nr:hypothetical protein CDD80_6602 [Ophiocordyceps camponoti-rufipedis]
MAAEDAAYLRTKGALTLPSAVLQAALLRAYAEFVHPFMPLLDLDEFLAVVGRGQGGGQLSLFLYQAVSFAATAFVDMRHLREAGFSTRKAARKAFFQRTRLLYDLDYEADRLVLVQGLMLMTYWYETPDDQKDTWHWMGVAVSLAHTIGLHRDPARTAMAPGRQRLWKRVWWSCVMRDRLVALGMRRPTRIKDEDFDVPMLAESDFDHVGPGSGPGPAPEAVFAAGGCPAVADAATRRELAQLCVAKAELCIRIGNMLRAQYSVMLRQKPDNNKSTTMLLFPVRPQADDSGAAVSAVDTELRDWLAGLPESCRARPLGPLDGYGMGGAAVAVQRTLLHMVFHTTVAALHRPQFLQPAGSPSQDLARLRVRDAAAHITRMAAQLHSLRLERFLPTTGVTVLLPAMIVHLLDMKSPGRVVRERAARGFRQCMRVMQRLRDMYAAADYATSFLDAALRKAAIDMKQTMGGDDGEDEEDEDDDLDKDDNDNDSNMHDMLQLAKPPIVSVPPPPPPGSVHTPPPDNAPYMTAAESLFAESLPPMPMLLPPETVTAVALELSGASSPPQTDSAEVTPSASGGSDTVPTDMGGGYLDMMQGPDEFDWSAMAGAAEFDVDQWLQFPPEGEAENEGVMDVLLGLRDVVDEGVKDTSTDDETRAMMNKVILNQDDDEEDDPDDELDDDDDDDVDLVLVQPDEG